MSPLSAAGSHIASLAVWKDHDFYIDPENSKLKTLIESTRENDTNPSSHEDYLNSLFDSVCMSKISDCRSVCINLLIDRYKLL